MTPVLLPWLADPNVAYLLLILAFYGIFFELTSPGLMIPGFLGLVCLGLSLYALQLMSLNETGLLILLTGLALMVVEVFVFTFGIAGMLGILAFVTGSVMLFDTQNSHVHVSWGLIIAMSLLSFTFIFMVLSLVVRSHQQKIVAGKEDLIDKKGVVLSDTDQGLTVRVVGEIWSATSSHPLHAGDKIIVTQVKGLQLTVEPANKHSGASS